MEIKRLKVGFYENNCYLLRCPISHEGVIIDPAADAGLILEESAGINVRYLLITHGHMDHIGALEEVKKKTAAPVGIHRMDARALKGEPDFLLEDGKILTFGREALTVLHTPGHTRGGVCFLAGKVLFSGDTIFPNGPGNTSLPGADEETILHSIHEKIFVLPDDTLIYPGHGLETTVGREKATFFYPYPQGARGERP